MPAPTVTARTGAAAETDADTRVVGVFEDERLDEPALQALVESGEAKPGLRKLAVTHEDGRRVILAGLGKRDELDPERARVAAAAAAGRARELGSKSLSWAAPSDDAHVVGAVVEGTLLALYRFDRFKSSPENEGGIESIEVTADADVLEAVEHARVVAEAQNAARDLQNTPSNVATPTFLAERAKAIADAHESVTLEVWDRDRIESEGMGAFTSVAQGTYAEPKLIVLRYEGGGSGPLLGYVGKAVTFDTGGISIKPSAKMHEMKFDMSGGAAVIESIGAIAELGVPARILAVVPSTENMPSGRSVKPGDIVTALNGKTIEVNNTDAEGRLILADALAYAVREGAERIVDLATLTGAIIVALGSTYAGLFSNDDDWCGLVEAASTATGELGWRLPLHPEYFELTKGEYADLTNASETRKAMSIYAAEFLRQFVDDRPWVHVDIAGTAWGLGRAYVGKGASGFGVRMLVDLAERAGGD
ncbi:MAG: leucyl aminopeptidase [Thermoleophilaceae bacterium]|jgi:leucyl aminopeptidase|nr:leucyl aminopeptidase [Thermoleophilaceae bacterium]MEA2368611.1 leucyl aminopeptidase [Thermoleophilaceae bacterium]